MSAARVGYLGLGSNVGDRRANLQSALDGLVARGVRVLASSSTYDTDPARRDPRPAQLPECRSAHRDGARAERAVRALKALERELGRRADGFRHGPRLIDVDVLLLGELEYSSERLRVPHAQVLERRFVLIPLLELDFELCTPAGDRLADALAVLDFDEGVRRAGPKLELPA